MTPQSTRASRTKLSARRTARTLARISVRPRHGGADIGELIRRTELRRDPPGQHDDEAIADVEQFVEIGGNQQYAAAARSRLSQRSPHERGRAHVEPSRRLRRDD